MLRLSTTEFDVATSHIRRWHPPGRLAALAMLALLPLANTSRLLAQGLDTNEARPRYGVFGDFLRSVHSADFVRLAGATDIPYASRFDGGDGSGVNLGALFEYPLSESIWLGLRGSYQSDKAKLRTSEQTVVIVADTSTFNGEFERQIDASIATASIEPMVGLRLPIGVMLSLGARASFVLSTSFDQRDVLTQPADRGVFENGRRIRNEASGEIPGASSMQTSAVFGVSRELAVNRTGTLFVVPEVFGSFAISPVSDSVSWSAHGLRFGIALKYAPLPAPPPIAVAPPPPPPPPPPVKPPVLAADVRAVSVDADGTEHPGVTIRFEEFISTQMRPLLNYVFFDEGSSAIPARYHSVRDTAAFQVSRLHGVGTLETYYDVLNIVGRRLRQNPRATITLTGTNAGTGAERGNTELSRTRAEAVREYLTSVWGIAADRLRVKARDLPEVPSDTAQAEAAAENRRVEISSSDPMILDAVFTDDTVRTVSPPLVRVYPSINSEAGVSTWQLGASQGAAPVASFNGSGSVPKAIDWNPAESRGFTPHSTDPIVFAMDVRDAAGQRVATPSEQLPVEQVTLRQKREEGAADKRTDRYGLILFDYDRADLNAANERIAALIRSRIPAGASVSITAFTDRIGEEDYNMRLSEARARATARAIGVPETAARGVGESRELYDNDLPEGRFYSRTVEILVESQVR
jgi:outer membrane protein OmpA-like peptidoglycan-associated protein